MYHYLYAQFELNNDLFALKKKYCKYRKGSIIKSIIPIVAYTITSFFSTMAVG